MVLNYLKIHWQIKYFLSSFYLEILRWSFVWTGNCYGNSLVEIVLGSNVSRPTYFCILKRKVLALFGLMERSLTWYCQLRFVSIFTPRHLTLSAGYSLLPHNFIFKLPSNFFCLDLKITISVFLCWVKLYLHLTN